MLEPQQEACIERDGGMKANQPNRSETAAVQWVQAGTDLLGEARGLSMSQIDFKVVPPGPHGVLILENSFQARGGPPRHLHFDQDEWFYVLAGQFVFEVGESIFRLQPGDSLLAPRRVPHVWAHVGDPGGRILVGFMPAGAMEAFFRKYMRGNVSPPKDPQTWLAHGMELLGPPLAVE